MSWTDIGNNVIASNLSYPAYSCGGFIWNITLYAGTENHVTYTFNEFTQEHTITLLGNRDYCDIGTYGFSLSVEYGFAASTDISRSSHAEIRPREFLVTTSHGCNADYMAVTDRTYDPGDSLSQGHCRTVGHMKDPWLDIDYLGTKTINTVYVMGSEHPDTRGDL